MRPLDAGELSQQRSNSYHTGNGNGRLRKRRVRGGYLMKRIKEGGERAEQTVKSSTREARCENSASRVLKGGKKGPPGPRGACSKQSRSQGGE